MTQDYDIEIVASRGDDVITIEQSEFLKYIQMNSDLKVKSPTSQQRMVFFSQEYYLGVIMFLQNNWGSIPLNILSNFLYDLWKRKPSTIVKLDRIVKNNEGEKKINFHGDKDSFKELMSKIKL